jgi:hypothetical protein
MSSGGSLSRASTTSAAVAAAAAADAAPLSELSLLVQHAVAVGSAEAFVAPATATEPALPVVAFSFASWLPQEQRATAAATVIKLRGALLCLGRQLATMRNEARQPPCPLWRACVVMHFVVLHCTALQCLRCLRVAMCSTPRDVALHRGCAVSPPQMLRLTEEARRGIASHQKTRAVNALRRRAA